MRSLERDKQWIWYCTVTGQTDLKDENGDLTGEKYYQLSKPTKYKIGVSATVGNPQSTPAGVSLDYTREMSTCDRKLALQEMDVLFIDIVPQLDVDGFLAVGTDGRYVTEPDYYVKKVMDTQRGSNARYGISKKA